MFQIEKDVLRLRGFIPDRGFPVKAPGLFSAAVHKRARTVRPGGQHLQPVSLSLYRATKKIIPSFLSKRRFMTSREIEKIFGNQSAAAILNNRLSSEFDDSEPQNLWVFRLLFRIKFAIGPDSVSVTINESRNQNAKVNYWKIPLERAFNGNPWFTVTVTFPRLTFFPDNLEKGKFSLINRQRNWRRSRPRFRSNKLTDVGEIILFIPKKKYNSKGFFSWWDGKLRLQPGLIYGFIRKKRLNYKNQFLVYSKWETAWLRGKSQKKNFTRSAGIMPHWQSPRG